MPLSLYLPISGSATNILLLLGLGGAVGFLSGLFGVGGGFLMTPLLIMAGIPSPLAPGTASNHIVAASPSGTYAHYRLGNVDFKMGLLLLIGGVVGGTLGVQLIKVLRAMGNADFVIKVTYVIMLGVIGSYMFVEDLKSSAKTAPEEAKPRETQRPSVYARLVQALPWQMRFEKSGVTLSPIMPL